MKKGIICIISFGLTSHHKAPVLNATTAPILTTKSPSGVQRTMATVSPLYQVSTGTPVPTGHLNVPTGHTVMSNSALAATRTSSFAAALRKLAKQAFDPGICATDNGQSNVTSGIVGNHSGITSKSASSFHPISYQSSLVPQSPPVVTIAPTPAHQIERNSDVRKYDSHSLIFDHRIPTEQSKESLHYTHAHRSSPIVQVRPSQSRDHDPSASSNHNSQSNLLTTNRSTGFQPYRSPFEDSLRSSSSSSALTGSALPSHLMPYADALTYPYHPFLPPPPIPPPSGLSHHSSYRLEDPYYIDRFNLLRNSLHGSTSSSLAHANTGASSVPFNLSRYSELLNSHHERIINDERQRLLNHTLAQTSFKTSNIESPPLHLNTSLVNDRRIEPNNAEHHVHSSLMVTKRDYPSSGSILSGTPRDVQPSSLQSLTRKSQAPISASVKPLNLSSSSEHSSSEPSSYLWRPQTDDVREHVNDQFKNQRENHVQNHEQNDDIIIHKNQISNSSDPLRTKRTRLNHFNNAEGAYISNGFNADLHDKSIPNAKFSISDKSEGLQTRIYENSERNINVNNNVSTFNNHLNSSSYYPSVEPQNDRNISKLTQNNAENEIKIISKLDLDEIRLKQKRINNHSVSDESDDDEENSDENESEDNDEDDDNKFKYKLMLTKVSPLKLETDPEKMKFFETLNLTTHKRKSNLEFHKYLKRRKILGEVSTAIDTIDNYNYNESIDICDDNKENPQEIDKCSIMPDSIASMERSNEVKLHFMATLGLRVQMSPEKQRDVEVIWEGILREREMRMKQNRCYSKILNNINRDTLNKWLNNLQSAHPNLPNLDSDTHYRYSLNGVVQNSNVTNVRHGYHGHHGSSHRGQRKVILFNKHNNETVKGSTNTESRSHNNHVSNRDFAQEFHESVLQTTRQQLARQQQQQSQTQEQQRHYADLSSSSPFKWPGIEAIMEAYERYSIEQKQEKDFLQDRSQQLKCRLQDINREAEYLSQKMADLVQMKNQLDDEREHHQNALDDLKKYLRQLK